MHRRRQRSGFLSETSLRCRHAKVEVGEHLEERGGAGHPVRHLAEQEADEDRAPH